MKARIIFVALAIILGCTCELASMPSEAHCAYCIHRECYSNEICGTGCFCLKAATEFTGKCYSIDLDRNATPLQGHARALEQVEERQ